MIYLNSKPCCSAALPVAGSSAQTLTKPTTTTNMKPQHLIASTFASFLLVGGFVFAEPIQVGVPLPFQPGIKGAVELTFQSEVIKYYQLEVSDDLAEWDNDGYSIKGTGGQMTLLASTRNLQNIFYRLRDDGDPANLAPSVPPGTIMAFAGLNPPSGWLLCDGSVYSQDFAPGLYAVIENFYNTGGEGAGNFRVPDLRGRVPVGSGQGSGLSTDRLLGEKIGSETNVLTAQNLPSHAHTIPTGTSTATQNPPPGSALAVVRATSANNGSVTTGATGSAMPYDIMQPSLVLRFIIKL